MSTQRSLGKPLWVPPSAPVIPVCRFLLLWCPETNQDKKISWFVQTEPEPNVFTDDLVPHLLFLLSGLSVQVVPLTNKNNILYEPWPPWLHHYITKWGEIADCYRGGLYLLASVVSWRAWSSDVSLQPKHVQTCFSFVRFFNYFKIKINK